MIMPNDNTPKKSNFDMPDGYSPAKVKKKQPSPKKEKPCFIIPDEDFLDIKPTARSNSVVIVPTMAMDTIANSSQITDAMLQGLSQEAVGDAWKILASGGLALETVDLDIDDIDDDYFLSMTQKGRCPMCNQAVDPDDLRAFGPKTMGIKQQEKFCRWHKTKTAEQDWNDNEYPTIDWTKLDSRIQKHHSFIKKLIQGEDSHYQLALVDKIKTGEDRTTMTTKTNLTPGYYGTRGLRNISENLMRKFTPLIQERIKHDRLIAARGFTPYVQTVLVPEVAVKLIMEDMKVDEQEAREILAASAEIGELMNEELRDVVTRNEKEIVVDSDESDGDLSELSDD